MADAGAIRAGDRLPWLEPYRPPARKTSNRRAGLAAGIGALGLAGVAALLAIKVAPLPEPAEAPSADIVLPAPSELQPQPEKPSLAASSEQASDAVARPAIAVRKTRHNRPAVRRRIKAEPTRDAFGEVLTEQADGAAPVAEISAESLAIAQLPAPPAEPLRPAVNPAARVVRGKTVQLGVFKTARQAEIAWQSAIRDYTYLVTMPKSIEAVRIRSKRYYRLQLGTPSKAHARQLCGNLKQIGRSCTVA